MVYVNLNNFQSLGAGAYAYLNAANTVSIAPAEYYYDAGGAVYVIQASDYVPLNTAYVAKVFQTTSSTSDCWEAYTYNGDSDTRCFAKTTYPINNDGQTATAPYNVPYVSGKDDMPGLFDYLQSGTGYPVSFGDYFSSSTTDVYKCEATLHGYVLSYLAGYSGNGDNDDKVGTGQGITLQMTAHRLILQWRCMGHSHKQK